MTAKGSVALAVQVIRRGTARAIQVVLTDGTIHWLPRSQLAREYDAGQRDLTIPIPQWLAIKRGLTQE
ncbi:MAG TPA: hypothetical protein VKD72_01375 [Gemmataceae bacterium]|nr:hypothetical protein [Gemmataceae bacterium]